MIAEDRGNVSRQIDSRRAPIFADVGSAVNLVPDTSRSGATSVAVSECWPSVSSLAAAPEMRPSERTGDRTSDVAAVSRRRERASRGHEIGRIPPGRRI